MKYETLDLSSLTAQQHNLWTTALLWSKTAAAFDEAANTAYNLGEQEKVKTLRTHKRFALERAAYCLNACTVAGGMTEEVPVWHAKIAQ
jgi:hypothetical protein